MNSFFQMFSYQFIVYALIVGISISICAALLGTSLVLKRNSMIGDGLSHVGFGACAIAMALNWAPLAFAIPIVIIASFLILKLSEKSKIHGDSAIALVASASLAIGYIVIHTSGTNIDVENYLYGSILGITKQELIMSVSLSIVVIIAFVLLYNKIFAITFDESFMKSTGGKTELYNIIISVLCSITVVLGMKLMGALLITSLIIFPTISARQIFKKYKSVVIASVVISVLCFFIGMVMNYYIDLPIGSTIVVVNLCLLLILMATSKIMNKIKIKKN
ncbi:MAG: metal ABC transporter permease [Acholeplasmatales bacterium]|nr:metal ABC transporter permease [Acholeplasmatales bacterium]